MSSPDAPPAQAVLPTWKRLLGWALRAFLLAFLWATFVEPELVVSRAHAFSPEPRHAAQWPAGCAGVRLAVVSDLHVGDAHMHPVRLDYIRRQVADSEPDLILIPGDFAAHVLGGRTLPMPEIARRLATWPDIAPVVAVLGNHDYSNAPTHVVIEGLESRGMDVLENQAREVSLRDGACRFWVAGVGDAFSGLDHLPAALENVPAGAPVILLTHDARVASKIQDPSRITMVLGGHSHGGVACVPGTRWCLASFHPWTDGWVRGWYRGPNHPPVLVSSGLGNSIYPARFGSPPGWDLVVWQ